MSHFLDRPWSKPLLACIAIASFASASPADERKVVREVIQLEDCPRVRVLGAEGTRVLSLSPRGFLGVETSNLTPELRQHFGVADDAGVMISRVIDESAASAAGLLVGDIVTHIAGEEVSSGSQLGRAVRGLEGGVAVDIDYWRDGARFQTTATIEERERCSFDVGNFLHTFDFDDLPKMEDLGIEISGEAIENAMQSVRDALQSQDWEKHFEGLKELDLEQIEERMEGVQERLEELEQRLEREYSREERSERDRERKRRRDERDRERQESEEGDFSESDASEHALNELI